MTRLTDREMDIVRAMLVRRTYREIGIEVDMAEQTVKNHINQIHRKVGVKTNAQLVWALRRELEGTAA